MSQLPSQILSANLSAFDLGLFLLMTALLLAPFVWVAQCLVRDQWRRARAQRDAPAWVHFAQLHCPCCGQQAMPLLRKWQLGKKPKTVASIASKA